MPTASGTPARAPSRAGTPVRKGPAGGPAARSEVSASPAVRARLAELRNKSKSAVNKDASISNASDTLDDAGDGSRSASPAISVQEDVSGLATIQAEIAKAKKSGRLNISARSLPQVPLVVYEHLVSRTSPFHPSNSRPPQPLSDSVEQQLNLERISLDESDQNAPKWWETADLTSFKAVNNELQHVDEELAGFESLEVLDLHSNAIQSPLPASFGTMVTLTSLNLSHNKLADWPLEIMALVQLRELDLSNNQLSRLWPLTWPKDLRTRLKGVGKPRKPVTALGRDADASFESVSSQSTAPDQHAGESFWNSFPSSSPTKPRHEVPLHSPNNIDAGDVPLPSLVSLNLAANRLKASAFAENEMSLLPPNLKHLDLSGNGISGLLPLPLFASLPSLRTLLLSDNGLDDNFFAGAPIDGSFGALTTLDLSKNAIDSLQYLEECFSQTHAITYQGITSASLKRAIASTAPPSDNSRLPTLSIDVTGNYLREEAMRRRKMKVHNKVVTDAAPESPAPQSTTVSNGAEAGYADSEARALRALSDVQALIGVWSQAVQGDPSNRDSLQAKLDALPGMLAAWRNDDIALAKTPTTSIFPSASTPVTPQVRGAKGSDNSSISSDTSFIASAAERRRRLKEAEQAWAPL